HVLHDPVELTVELLARDDRRARLRHADAMLDHEVREGAIRERGNGCGGAAAQGLITRALAEVLAQLLQPLVGEALIQRAEIAGEAERADLLRVLALGEEVEDVAALALV